MTFAAMVRDFQASYMPKLAMPTRLKYASLLQCHVLPAFGEIRAGELTTRRIDEWLSTKAADGLSWATRSSLRNLISSVFTRAERWGTWDGRNPARYANPGRRRAHYEKRKLTIEETTRLMHALRPDVRLVCMIGLFCGLRISEVLGLQWQHVDFQQRVLLIRQRYWRGDVDSTKSEAAVRDVPYGALHDVLQTLYSGNRAARNRFCFSIQTQSTRGITRDDRSIRRYFLRPAAESLGIYYRGFGFHAFRREAITAIAREAGVLQACRLAGHTRLDHTLLYGLDERKQQERAIRAIQEPFVTAGILRVAS